MTVGTVWPAPAFRALSPHNSPTGPSYDSGQQAEGRRRLTAMRARLNLLCCALFGMALALGVLAQDDPVAPDPVSIERKKVQLGNLVRGLRDPDLAKVRTAVAGLIELGLPQVCPALWQLYDLGDGHRRSLALEAIGRLKAPAQQDRMFDASLAEALWSLRRLATESLARLIGRDEATQRYLQALDEPRKLSALGRVRAIQSFAHLGGKGAAERLKALIHDKDADAAMAACDGLAEIGDLAHTPALIEALGKKSLDVEVRPALAEALEALTGKKYGANLVEWEKWQDDWKAGKFAAPPIKVEEPLTIGEPESTYAPPPEPYQRPVKESPVDFVIVFDTTRSMVHIWPEVSTAIDAVLKEITKSTPSARLGGVRYRAANSQATLTYLIQPKPLTRKLQEARDFLLDASFGGGSGGLPLGLQHAISALAWRVSARKIVLVVGDFTPLDEGLAKCLAMIKEGWEHDRIVFHQLYCATSHGDEHKNTYHILAEAGGGRFYEYNKAWSRLLDLSAEKVDPKKAELASETCVKWLTPLVRKAKP